VNASVHACTLCDRDVLVIRQAAIALEAIRHDPCAGLDIAWAACTLNNNYSVQGICVHIFDCDCSAAKGREAHLLQIYKKCHNSLPCLNGSAPRGPGIPTPIPDCGGGAFLPLRGPRVAPDPATRCLGGASCAVAGHAGHGPSERRGGRLRRRMALRLSVACTRKRLTYANYVVQRGTPWMPQADRSCWLPCATGQTR
jgi:hypothetical protein